MKKGIAISLYDKFDDLAILVDIIRENWEDKYYISVCSKHPDAYEEISELDIDHFTSGTPIKYNPSWTGQRERINLTCRILDSFKNACKGAIDNCEYVMHLHADAWPLSESKINELVNKMEDKDAKAAFRGKGLSYRRSGSNLGHVMDQFCIFETSYTQETGFFEFHPMDLVPDIGIHTSLMILLLGKIGLSNVWWYSDMTRDENYDGTSTNLVYTGVRPSAYNPQWKLLHVATDEFLNNDGEKVQAMYLQQHDINKGQKVSELLEEHSISREQLLDELKKKERGQNLKLRLLGFSPEKFDKKFKTKQDILDQPVKNHTQYLGKNILRKAYYATHRFIFAITPFEDSRFPADKRKEQFFSNATWPTSLNNVYGQSIDKSDYPENYQELWFEK
jgi:arsenate reductase-like glutaredoxin family protein